MSVLHVGDKITSRKFAYGYQSNAFFQGEIVPVIDVDGITKVLKADEIIPENERVRLAAITHQVIAKSRKIDLARYDSARGTALFVVEQVSYTGQDNHENIPDEEFIIARQLNPNGRYDPTGTLIAFYHQGKFHPNSISNVTLVGHMQLLFV